MFSCESNARGLDWWDFYFSDHLGKKMSDVISGFKVLELLMWSITSMITETISGKLFTNLTVFILVLVFKWNKSYCGLIVSNILDLYIYIYTHTYIYLYTHTHTYIYIVINWFWCWDYSRLSKLDHQSLSISVNSCK